LAGFRHIPENIHFRCIYLILFSFLERETETILMPPVKAHSWALTGGISISSCYDTANREKLPAMQTHGEEH